MIKTEYLVYSAKNYTTGLTDVTATIFKDGSDIPVATGIALDELNSTDAPGRYKLTLSPSQINSFGGVGDFKILIDSTSRRAPATASLKIKQNDNDDLAALITTVSGKIDILETKIDAIQSDLTTVKTKVESTNDALLTGPNALQTIKGLVETALSGITSMRQATRTVVAFPAQLITPPTGLERYTIPINIHNTDGALEDPDGPNVYAELRNAAGLDRSNYLKGFTSGPFNATRLDTGKYKVELEIPAGAAKEQLNLIVSYTENTVPMEAVRTANIVSSVDASGLAQQVTAQAILDDTSVMQPQVATMLSELQSATYGLAILKNSLNTIDSTMNSLDSIVNSNTIGNQAIIDAIATKASQASVNNISASVDSIKGVGYNEATDSLKSISDKISMSSIV